MQRVNKSVRHISDVAVKFYHRHRILCRAILAIIILYAIVRIFFTPPILNQTHFSNAYYDRKGQLLRLTLSADDKYRLYVPLNEISTDARRAIILYEDRHFYRHPGINPVALFRAFREYAGGATHPAGASTITMQVARLRYDINTKNPRGKLKQIVTAIYLDAFHSKSEILEAYLNLAPYGGNIEGIGAAAQIFFHKPASRLSTIESITLATIPQNPTKRNISTKSGLANIMRMRADLVRRWLAEYPATTDLDTLANMPLAVHTISDLPWLAPHFVDRLQSEVRTRWMRPGPRTTTTTTTLDIGLQNQMTHALQHEISRRRHIGVNNAAAILVNYKTMETLAYIGSSDYFDQEIFGENDGVRARRSPGSTLKPLIYAAAVDRGLIHGMTLLRDAKINFGVYAPENSDNEFYGPVLARDALTHSRNIPAINLLRGVGLNNFYNLLVKSGVANLKKPSHYGVSLALGGAEVSMFELATIYATMANLGMHHEIRTDMNTPLDSGTQLLRPEAFFLTLDMLARQKTLSPNIPFAKRRHTPVRHYWKTGTSSSYRDAWTAGIFGDYVLVVWVGNFDGRPNNAFSGAKTAAPIYFALAAAVTDYAASHGAPVTDNNFMHDDLNISTIDMCDGVGGIAGTHCPHAVPAYFIPGVSPIDMSSVYRAIPIDKKTGLRACTRDPETTYMEVYEFWDAEYLDMFRRAGITRKTPPNYLPGCDLDAIANTRTPPVIISPSDNTRTVIVDNSGSAEIAFRAATDMPDIKIFWFLDDRIIGTSLSGETFSARVPIGRHRVRAADELGTAATAEFMVVQ